MTMIVKKLREYVEVKFEENGKPAQCGFNDAISMIMNALSVVIRDFIKKADVSDKEAFSDNLYDAVDSMFSQFLRDCFPKIAPTDAQFGLTEAAIIYAQDQIIQKAEKEGKTYEQMIDEYNAIANKYINEKRGLS